MAQTLSDGAIFNYTTTGAVANGQLLVLGRMAGVALNAATGAGQSIAVAMEGVFSVASVATGAKTRGLRAMYRSTGSQLKVTTVSGVAGTGKYTIGNIWETAATTAATTVKIKLIGGPIVPIA
jgi:predicted RecA/RadA family phage recombinase